MTPTQKPGLSLKSRFTPHDQNPFEAVAWDTRSSIIRNPDGSVVFEMNNARIPQGWSQVATDILAQKYFRKAGIPALTRKVAEAAVPEWLQRSVPDSDALAALPDEKLSIRERDGQQVRHRLPGCWRYWGWKYDYFR